jgi:hypothetical protein
MVQPANHAFACGPQAKQRNSSASEDADQPAPQALFLSFPNMLFSLLTRGQPLMTEVD